MWYVLHVTSGKELDIAAALRTRQMISYVPRENRAIRRGGKWTFKEYTLFPGYVFVNLDYTAENYYKVCGPSGIPGVQRFLGPDGLHPSSLSYLEAEWIKILSGSGEPIAATPAQLTPEGEVQLGNGVLQNFLSRIIKIDKHSRRATVEITVCGEARQLELSFDLLSEDSNSESDGG